MLHETLSRLVFERKVTKTHVADQLGIARSTLNGYLSGAVPVPSDVIEKAAAFFGVTVGYLFGETRPDNEVTRRLDRQQKEINEIKEKVDLIAKSLQVKKE